MVVGRRHGNNRVVTMVTKPWIVTPQGRVDMGEEGEEEEEEDTRSVHSNVTPFHFTYYWIVL